MSKNIHLVTGATGETGRSTIEHLLAQGRAVRALVHSDDGRAQALRSQGAEVVIGNLLEHDDGIRATDGAETAYFCYPVRPGIIQASAYFADAAKRAGLKLVVNMSQISARGDSKSHAARDHWIAERIFDWSGVPVTHLRPTFFSQWLLYPHIRGTLIEKGIIDLPYGEGRHAPIAAEDQARLIAMLLASPKGHEGKTYNLFGPDELDQEGIAAAISDVLGRTIRYQPISISQYRQRLASLGLPEFLIQHFCAIAVDYRNGIFSGKDEVIGKLTGTAPMGVAEFISLHRAAFETVGVAA